jgi:CRP-like cAMP-binding protein
VLTAGEAFGEIALVSNEKRTATILVNEDTDFATINRYEFQRIIRELHENIREKKIIAL